MIRAPLGSDRYWEKWVHYRQRKASDMWAEARTPAANPIYAPQFTYQVAIAFLELAISRYSRGDAVADLSAEFRSSLAAWEEAEDQGRAVWTREQQYLRHAWKANFDHYIFCFWFVGLALVLEVPDTEWQRLLVLVGNEGEDVALDRVIASRSSGRKIGKQLCFARPYSRLLEAIDAPIPEQARKLSGFVASWYDDLRTIGSSGHAKQAVPHQHPYWHKLGDENLEGGAYFGRWCIEAVAAVKAFGLDDSLCLGLEHYPGDLLRPNAPTTHLPRASNAAGGLLSRLLGRR